MINVVPLFPPLGDVRVPQELRELRAWLVWRFEQVDGEPRPRKMPYWADGGRRRGEQGVAHDRARLVTFDEAREAAIRGSYAGVGFAPLAGCGYTFLDFDNCVDEQGNIPNDIMAIVGRTYAEYSPSGKGVRAVLKGDLGNRKSHGEPYGLELFASKGFVTFTGNILHECDLLGGPDHIAAVDVATQTFVETRFGPQAHAADPADFMAGREPRLGLSIPEMEELLSCLDPSMAREPWLKVGLALHHETQGDDTGFDLWDTWSSDGDTYPGDEQLRSQWDRFETRPGRPSVTMATVKWMAKEAGYGKELTAEQVLAKADGAAQREERGPFAVLSYDEVQARKPPEWLIKGVLPKGELGVIYGPSGSGKSFVAMDLALAIARGVPWRGRRVKQGEVVIVAAEGGGGVQLRLKAYQQHHGLSPEDMAKIGVVLAAPNFLEQEQIGEVIGEIRKFGNVSTVIIDTFAQVTPGANENSSEDMGRALANVKLLHRATGAMPLLVHHAGKDLSKGSRGWSGIKAAAEAQLEVTRKQDDLRCVKIEKMKDGLDGEEFWFKLNVVDLGIDVDGDPFSSCVVVPTEQVGRATTKAPSPRGATQRKILDTALKCGAGEFSGASVDEVITKAVDLIAYDPRDAESVKSKRDQRRTNVKRTLQNLCEQGFLVNDADRIYLPSAAPSREA